MTAFSPPSLGLRTAAMQIFQHIQTFIGTAGRVPLLSFLLATVGCPLLAQSDFVSFGHLTTEQDLSQDFVLCIAQDRDGFLWFGTNDGLARYDGRNCTVFHHRPGDSTVHCPTAVSATSVTMLRAGSGRPHSMAFVIWTPTNGVSNGCVRLRRSMLPGNKKGISASCHLLRNEKGNINFTDTFES